MGYERAQEIFAAASLSPGEFDITAVQDYRIGQLSEHLALGQLHAKALSDASGRLSSATARAVPAGVSRRIEKLAKEAGRTPAQTLKFVIRDGLEQTEYAVRQANAGLAELDAGKGIPPSPARRRAEAGRRHRVPADR